MKERLMSLLLTEILTCKCLHSTQQAGQAAEDSVHAGTCSPESLWHPASLGHQELTSSPAH